MKKRNIIKKQKVKKSNKTADIKKRIYKFQQIKHVKIDFILLLVLAV